MILKVFVRHIFMITEILFVYITMVVWMKYMSKTITEKVGAM